MRPEAPIPNEIIGQSVQPNPLEGHYSNRYRRYASDSTPDSRTNLRRASREAIWSLGEDGVVIDIGSGPQQFEHELFTAYGRDNRPKATFLTVDFAEIPQHALKASKYSNVHHIRANGATLPFQNETADVVVSNMGIEYLPEGGLASIRDVLKPGGVVFVNWWTSRNGQHEATTDEVRKMSKSERSNYEAWNAFVESRIAPHLGKNAEEIKAAWEENGFEIEGFEEVSSKQNQQESWYQIVARKKAQEQPQVIPFEVEEYSYIAAD